MDQVTDLPDFDVLFWAKDNQWILTNNSEEGAYFTIFDLFSQEIVGTYEFADRIGIYYGLDKPILSPDENKLAFFGAIDPQTNLPTLYTLSLCEGD